MGNPIQLISVTYQLIMQKYSKLDLIGEGAYGIVWKCKHMDTNELVAIKKFKESEEDDENVKKTTNREIRILRMLDHPNIVRLKQALRKKGIVFLIFQYCPYNLLEIIERNNQGIDSEMVRQIIYQLLKAISYMHSMNIIHRDIKPQNILVSESSKINIKLCDFGFAREMKSKELLTDYVATRWYRAPELLIGMDYDKPIDIWAIGCILGELIDGAPLYPGADDFDQLHLIQKSLGYVNEKQYEHIVKNNKHSDRLIREIDRFDSLDDRYGSKINSRGLDLLKKLLKMAPEERITASQALKHPYFDTLREDPFKKHSENETRVISACDYTYNDKKREFTGYVHDDDREGTISSIYASKNSKSQIKKKEENIQNQNILKVGIREGNCKSMSKNTKKSRDHVQINIQPIQNLASKHTRGTSKTQMDFYPEITEPKEAKEARQNRESKPHVLQMPSKMSVNKIYGSNYTKQSVRFKSISKRTAEPSDEMNDFQEYSTMHGMSGISGLGINGLNMNIGSHSPYILFGSNTRKKSKSREKQGRNNINIIINNNTWVQPGSIVINK